MFSFQGAPIMNKGYYDVPINNQYSNTEYRDTPVVTNEYQLNKNINVTMNDNKDEYIVYQQPTRPSKSLYIESDQQTTQYYNNERALSFDSHIPLMKRKEQNYNEANPGNYASFPIESFHGGGGGGYSGGQGGRGGYSGGEGSGYSGRGYNRGYDGGSRGYVGNRGGYDGGYGGANYYGGIRGNPVVLANGGHPYINRAYLNTQIMPNISRNYWESPDYGYEYEYVPEYVPVIKQPPYNIIPKEEDIKIEQLLNQENVEIEEEKPKKKKKCNKIKNKIKNKVFVSNQILWCIIIILLLVIVGFIIKTYYNK